MSYFSPCLPIVITTPGQYRTRSGETVTVEAVGTSIVYCDCYGTYSNGIAEGWNRTGRIFTGIESQNDIIAKV